MIGRLIVRGVFALALVLAASVAIIAPDLDRHWPLDLRDPPGVFTRWRIRALAGSPEACRLTLIRSGAPAARATPRPVANGCGYDDGVAFAASAVALTAPPAMRCPLAAAYAAWELQVVRPAASTHLGGAAVASIRHFGSYSCRNIYGRSVGRRSQHATANAIDIAGFRLADGRTITLLADWDDAGPEGRFLRAVRDGACRLFSVVLSPDYNAAHRDHFHFDLGSYVACR